MYDSWCLFRIRKQTIHAFVSVAIVTVFFSSLLSSCDVFSSFETVTFENNTSYTIAVTIDSSVIETDTDSLQIAPGSSGTLQSEYGIVPLFSLSVVGNSALNVRYSEYSSTSRVVFEGTYEFVVQYIVSGTAPSVDVTLSNATGGTEQHTNVLLPVEYNYSTFSDTFLYISAQNNGTTGTVTAECYYRGLLRDSATSTGAYVIATASGSTSN